MSQHACSSLLCTTGFKLLDPAGMQLQYRNCITFACSSPEIREQSTTEPKFEFLYKCLRGLKLKLLWLHVFLYLNNVMSRFLFIWQPSCKTIVCNPLHPVHQAVVTLFAALIFLIDEAKWSVVWLHNANWLWSRYVTRHCWTFIFFINPNLPGDSQKWTGLGTFGPGPVF